MTDTWHTFQTKITHHEYDDSAFSRAVGRCVILQSQRDQLLEALNRLYNHLISRNVYEEYKPEDLEEQDDFYEGYTCGLEDAANSHAGRAARVLLEKYFTQNS